jgi:hypothetical protein
MLSKYFGILKIENAKEGEIWFQIFIWPAYAGLLKLKINSEF